MAVRSGRGRNSRFITPQKPPTSVANSNELPTNQRSISSERGETKVLPDHCHNILNGMEVLWRQNTLCDAILNVDGTRFRAHRTVLCSCSDYFHNIFTNTPDEPHPSQVDVSLEGIRPETMQTLLECMYTGSIRINESNVREILAASANLKFYAIEDACGSFLKDRLNVSNCLRMLNMAFTYHLKDLVDTSLQTAAKNFMEVSDGFDFQHLSLEELLCLIQRDDVQADSELDIFRRSMLWVEFDKSHRIQNAAEIMHRIRLPLLRPSDVVDYVETVDFLMEIPECQRLVKEALHYHCLPCRQSILQTERTNPRTTAKRDVILATGGAPRMKNEPVCNDVICYDPETQSWEKITKMKEPRHHHAAVVLGGFLYVAGGEETNDQRSPLNTAYRYDPRANVWLAIASMKHRRESFQLSVLNGMLYAVGGRVDQDVSLAEVERYNPAVDSWETVASLSTPRRSVAVAAHNGRLYAMGGSGHKRISSKVERYNPLTNQWESRKPLGTPRFFASLVATQSNKRLFLFGGGTLNSAGNITCVKKVECYFPTTDTWSQMSPMLVPRVEAGVALLGDKIYVMGGYSWDKNERLLSTEVYDCDRDKWTRAKDMDRAYTGIASCALTIYDLSLTPLPANDSKEPEATDPDVNNVVGDSDSDDEDYSDSSGGGDRVFYIPHTVQSVA